MAYKMEVLVLALAVAACYALPQPKLVEELEENDMSFFFSNAEYTDDTGSRIVGGTQAESGSVPYMVALSTGSVFRSHFCGGSLISRRHVLTAAHCIAHVYSRNSLTSSLRGHVGSIRWNSGSTLINFSHNVSHPHYLSASIKNDIGILVTSSNVALTERVQIVPLSFEHAGCGIPVKVAGFGATRGGGSLSNSLLELYLSTIDANECINEVARAAAAFNVRAPPVEPHIELCTFHSTGHGTCNGDSGSALVRVDSGEQIGLVSWGFPCARGAPDMYARVGAFKDFIVGALNSL